MKMFIALMGFALATLFLNQKCIGAYLLFDSITDTIGINNGTILNTTATFEAVVSLNSNSPYGSIYFEEVSGLEHKSLDVGPNHMVGYVFNGGADIFEVPTIVTPNVFHHVAFVHDNTNERLYLDGNLIASRTYGANIWNSPNVSHPPAIGASQYDINNIPEPSFLGLLQSVRISNVARYSGSSFMPTIGELPNDPSTLILYNFNQSTVIGNTVYDQSGNGRNGTLGVGFVGATSPTLVPEPSTLALLGMSGIGLIAYTWRRKKPSRG
jgi:hypothetical protein